LTRAAGAESAPVNIVDAFKTALPDLLETQGISGELAKNPVQLSKIVGDSLSRTETEFNLKMQPIAGQEFMPSGIADEIEAKAREFPSKTAESRAIRTSLMKRAAEFRQPWNLQELNQERMASNGRLYGFAGKKGSAQAAVTHTNADIIADQIIARASRDVIYDRMEAHYGTPDYFRALKKRQSAMIAISDQMAKQLVKLGNLEAYDNLLGRLRGHSYMSSGGHVGFSLGNLLGAPFSEAFKAGRGVKKGLAPPREAGSAAPQAILTGATALAPRATPPAPRRNPSDEWADPAQLQR
jgi:hypothetical protein